MSNPRRKWSVKVTGSKRRVLVEAGYCKLDEAGNLWFRTWRGDRFPDLERMFAAGHWLEVSPA